MTIQNNLLISGKSGFVGRNWDIYVKKNNLKFKNFRLKSHDIENSSKLKKLFNNKYAVLHLCGLAHDLKNHNNEEQYYKINTEYTKKVFDQFLDSNLKIFIFISSIKSVSDSSSFFIDENTIPNPITDYGKSKLLAENYILSKKIPEHKKVYILRPTMIHGFGNKGNFNLLFKYLKMGFPWILGSFENKRSFCSIENLCFVLKKLFENKVISGVYNVCDSEPVSTNDIVRLIISTQKFSNTIIKFPKPLIELIFKFLDFINFKFNSNHLNKLTSDFLVSNKKLVKQIGDLPLNSKEGLKITFKNF